MQILTICISLRPNGEWNSESEIVFNSNKAALQMKIIEFREDLGLKEKYNQVLNILQCERFWIKFVCSSKFPELKSLAT